MDLLILDRDDLELVLDVVRTADADVAAEFATRAWRAIPERALEEARTAYEERLASAEGWFALAPRAQLGHLVGVVRASSPVAPWVPAWAFLRLVDAGPHAEELFQLAKSARLMAPRGASRVARRSARGGRRGCGRGQRPGG